MDKIGMGVICKNCGKVFGEHINGGDCPTQFEPATLAPAEPETTPYPEITTEEALAILQAKGGADFYAYRVSGLLRGLQRKGLGWDDRSGIKEPKNSLVTLTKAMQAPKGSEQQPYFGAIATAYGVKVAKWRVKNI